MRAAGTLIDPVPNVFSYPRDPKDEHYVDLAIAASATLVVSRDKDLLALADPATVEGQDFAARFPAINIVTPVEMLARLAAP